METLSTSRSLLSLAVALAACKHQPEADTTPTRVDATVSDVVSSVITVTWHTADPVAGSVAFGLDGKLDRTTPAEPKAVRDHRAVLVGLPADSDVSWQIDGDSEVHTTTTGSLPDWMPTITPSGSGNDQFLMLSLVGETDTVLVMLDPDGEPVWWYHDTRPLSAFRALVSHDGAGVVYNPTISKGEPSPDSVLVRVPWDGSTEDVVAVPNLAHDFVELPDLTLVAIQYVTQDSITGSGLVEIGRDGGTSAFWNTWDCLDPVENPSNDPSHGWTHANALDYEESDDSFLVGMRNLGTIEHVDRGGACAWGFGGSGGTVDITGPTFIHEHQFERTPGGMLVFDNDGAPGDDSRVLEYSFDEAAQKASLVRTMSHVPPLYSFIMGDVHRMDDGDTFVLFSVPREIDRMDPSGAVKWSVSFDGQPLLGFFQPLANPYDVP